MSKNNNGVQLLLAVSVCLLGFASIMMSLRVSKLEKAVCNPRAYYGRSEHILTPNCSPQDTRCAVDACR